MPSVSHDGRSFLVDGRRIWLVSGTLAFQRIERESWRDRIHAARSAGLNAVETPVYWNRLEPRPGKFDFTGSNDLRHFAELVKKAGMYLSLRVGPFVGDGWDLGGLPSWLLEQAGVRLRTNSQPFLEACSRYVTALAEQVRGLQITSAGEAGPLTLIQVESGWTCGKESLAHDYLGELHRYIRESGFNIPIVNDNKMWQSVEGEIDGWSGSEEMLAAMRQLSTVHPTAPRLVVGFGDGAQRAFGVADQPEPDGWQMQRRLAEVLAGGAQFNIRPFAEGIATGFWGGRGEEGPAQFVTPTPELGALVDASGVASARYGPVRRLCHFASRFARVFSHLDPAYHPVAIDPSTPTVSGKGRGKAGADPGAPSVVHAMGTQGSVAFIFDGEGHDEKRGPRTLTLLLADGSTMPVTLGRQPVAWCLFGAHVHGRSVLDYCNLNVFASVGPLLVAYGPAGARAVLSVNGSPIEVQVPSGKAPLVIAHEGLTLVIVSEDEIDRTYVTEFAVFVGVLGVTWSGQGVAVPGEKSFVKVDLDGKVTKEPGDTGKGGKSRERIVMGPWSTAGCAEYTGGTSPRYATIEGPADLTSLGCPFGYGWYRVALKSTQGKSASVIAPGSGDRLHLFVDGQGAGTLGLGPGASRQGELSLPKGAHKLVVLAENLGRFAGGGHMGEPKGLAQHLWEHATLKPGRAKLVRAQPVDVLGFRSPMWETRDGDATLPERVTWTLTHRRKSPVFVRFTSFPGRAVLLVNEAPRAYVDGAGPEGVLLGEDDLGKGNNTIQLALFGDSATGLALEDVESAVEFLELTEAVTAKGEFAFAKWEVPSSGKWSEAGKAPAKGQGPTWWRCHFRVGEGESPLSFDPAGLTKGQFYVNGRHVSRYFVGEASGKKVPPQDRYAIPASWVKRGADNELMVFDEHGASPAKARVAGAWDQRPILA